MKRNELNGSVAILQCAKQACVVWVLGLIAITMLTACGGGSSDSASPSAGTSSSSSPPVTYKISVNVSGLAGSGLVLRNNGGDSLTVTANGSYDFATALASSAAYGVTAFTQPTNPSQTCDVTNGSGMVGSSNVTNVAVVCVTNTYSIGGNILGLTGTGLVLGNNGEPLSINGNGTFSFATAVSSGGSYNVTITTQPISPVQTCTIANVSGVVTNANISAPAVTCTTQYPRFAFATNFNDNTVSAYTVNPVTGQLRHNGYVASGSQPHSVTVHPSGKFVYVSNYNAGLSGYAVSTNGRLTTLFDPTGCGNCGARGVTIDPSGKFLYLVYDTGNIVEAYAINADGTLSFIADDFSVINPFSVTIDSAGKFAYVTSYVVGNSGFVHAFAIQANGALSSIDTDASTTGTQASIAAGAGTHALVLHPSGKFALTANNINDIVNNGNSVSVFAVNAATGALTPIDANPAQSGIQGFPAGYNPRAITVDPSGRFVYVANFGGNNISAYNINPDTGVLTALPGGLIPVGAKPSSVNVDPQGKYLYVNNLGSNDTTVFTIDGTTGVPGAARTIAGRNGNLEMAMTRGTAPVIYTPKYAYVANYSSNTISQYSIGTNGALSAMPTSTAGTAGHARSVTIDPSGRYAYVANYSASAVSQYTIDASGALHAMSTPTVPTGSNSISITVDPSGRYAYVVDYSDNAVWQYTVGTNGALSAMSTPAIYSGTGPLSITIDPSGRYAYVTNTDSNSVSQYTIDASGALHAMLIQTVGSGAGSYAVTVDPSGRYVYVTNYSGNTISQYTIGANGALSAMPTPTVASGTSQTSLMVEPSGRYAYVVNYSDSTISQYTIGANGALSAMSTPTASSGAYAVTVEPSGRYVYVTNYSGNTISQYTIGANGALSAMSTPTVGSISPRFITTTGTIE